MNLEWKDPPKTMHEGGRSLVDWFAVAKELQARPGEWALVLRDCYRANATRIVQGRNMAFRDGMYEATVRNSKPDTNHNRGDLYVRYVGPRGGRS